MISRLLAAALAAALAGCGQLPFAGAKTSSGSSFHATAEQQHTVEKMNEYRAAAGVPGLTIDGGLSSFATDGSNQLADDGQPHAHFKAAGTTIFEKGFCSPAAENQAANWPSADVTLSIDRILAGMMAEGPGGGHHDNILNPQLVRVGVGLVVRGGLYFTTDFSGACQ